LRSLPDSDVAAVVLPRLAGLALACVLVAEASAQELVPQPPRQRGGFFVPMVSVAETLDDNLLFTQFPEADFVTRVSLGVETGYRSAPFTVEALASRAGDFFSRHPDFDTLRGRTLGHLTLRYLPFRSLTISVFGGYLDTKTPSELNLGSGLAVGRSLATRTNVFPSIEYRLGRLWTLSGAFLVAHDTLDGRISDTQTAMAGIDRRVSRRDTVSLRYEHRWFDFTGGDKSESSTADVVTAGWLGDLGERTLLLLRAGPRFGKGEVQAEVLATLKHRVKRGLVTLTYAKSQATTLGKTGSLDTQSLVATLALRLSRNLEVASGPGLYRNSLRGLEVHALRLNLETLWHFSPWLHLGASYSLDVQQPDFGVDGWIKRSAFQMRIVGSPPQRRPEPSGPALPVGQP
jgi:hypothetical protein